MRENLRFTDLYGFQGRVLVDYQDAGPLEAGTITLTAFTTTRTTDPEINHGRDSLAHHITLLVNNPK